jgi:excinuclease ABC subunit A
MAEVLDMTVAEAIRFFQRIQAIRRPLEMLEQAGLDYILLGQPLSTLSGGELQRMKLARELASKKGEKLFYIMDTPSKGLHEEDVRNFVVLLKRLRDNGHTVFVIEHREQILAAADVVLYMGKENRL